ncbi:hypothetical protein DESUT3_17210 [Desulfuromonas versatilis]|uniref:PA14 domain-containing protein n=1 Tax=Desulfuromonas versatilis TaxID=2802975 RepID=A0ABN6DX03_9BACT|nr:PilC/PilY family type IV pilus protein [Desulfuromonas versatilis]BCR04652.1 hypothetical protein DESUT3_17210 [Desulfuromonas versatilis]
MSGMHFGKRIGGRAAWVLALLLGLTAYPALVGAGCLISSSGTYIEAEDYNTLGDNFQVKSSGSRDQEYAGNNSAAYLQATSNNDTSHPPSGTPVSFNLNFPESGTWYLWIRGWDDGNSGRNSIWYGLNGSAAGNATTPASGDRWYWVNERMDYGSNPIRLNIPSAGNHTVNFWTREKHFKFDGFYLTRTSGSIPSGNIPAGALVIDPAAADCGSGALDADGDGYPASNDCNDGNDQIHPGASEVCDGADNNCNGTVDEGCAPDADGDGYSAAVDCNDGNPFIFPGAPENCGDGIDQDCSGADLPCPETCTDADGDGYYLDAGGCLAIPFDCDDGDAAVNPGAAEVCENAVDENCNGLLSEGCAAGSVGGAVSQVPLFLSQNAPPLNLLVLGRDHKLYYEAYNDASDLNGDGTLDAGYKPASIDYFGYFDSHKCYSYDSAGGRFVPAATTADKTCDDQWSGDFLNYLTTSRMDALRKVLYGGRRVSDTSNLTVLERSHIPQDAHSWGKEYTGIAKDGYDLRDYAPASIGLPEPGYRHLFANTTLGAASASAAPGPPLLRVLNDSKYRVWEWLSIERPVAGSKCLHGSSGPDCATAGGVQWEIVPSSAFKNLTRTTYGFADLPATGHPGDHAAYDTLVANLATPARRNGSGSVSRIDGSGNPFGSNDYYLSIFTGKLEVPAAGSYTFAVDGDDAVELIIDGTLVASWYGGHGNCSCQSYSGSIFLTAGEHDLVFRHEEITGGDNYALYWQRSVPASSISDYTVRVEVCKAGLPEENCKTYPAGSSKPTGLLQEYGEEDLMMFGLLTGSYAKNTSGGVLRKKVSSITDEIDLETGQFTSTVGIVKTIDRLRTVGFSTGYAYEDNCSWITNGPLTEGKCRMWGNPVAEMMYEGLRYFAGKGSATSAFSIAASGNDDASLGLPLASWDDPYGAGGHDYCAKPFQLVISDINPSYDTDQVPGTGFGSFSGDVTGLNVSTLGDDLWDHEYGDNQDIFIGQSGSTTDGAPTVKEAESFRNIRGLAPEEPTKLGGFYGGSIAQFGQTHDLNGNAPESQNMGTFAVALASPLPQIRIPVAGQEITLVPFAKSVGGNGISAVAGSFQPTNTIVDFYVESLTPSYGKFRINFEDVEQGADHDMDAIVEYVYTVNADDTVTVTLDSTYAAGGIIQHMGYVVSGTTADGTYLEVRDQDTATGSDPDYFLDTPPGQRPGQLWSDGQALPLTATRTFTPSNGSGAGFLKDPLWYAAKYGQFEDKNGNDLPDAGEWDQDADGKPDNYFLVTNALTLSEQLASAFNQILGTTSSAAAIATNSTRLDTDTRVYQARFDSNDWSGQMLAYGVNADGSVGDPEWDASELLPQPASRRIFTYKPSTGAGTEFLWDNLDAGQKGYLNTGAGGVVDNLGSGRLGFLRGIRNNELQYGGAFRDRSRVLGDIVNSDPWFTGTQNYGYADLPDPEGPAYLSFRADTAYLERVRLVYTGGNDGMLHAFDAIDGDEEFAYVPNAVYPHLSKLTDPNYQHRFFVDGSPRATDAYLDVNGDSVKEWRTILVGTLGAGGAGVFALDVTDPANFGADDVLWEINASTAGFADLGVVLGQAYIVRMANGTWAAVFGNGFGSASGKALLYIVDLATGSLIRAIDTGVGSVALANGLGGATPVDYPVNRIVDAVYAGDLQGNLWKFDVSHSNSAQWAVAFKQGTTPKPLFTARGPSGNIQPITARPEIGRGPSGADGIMVYFGTGQYYAVGDNVVSGTPPLQSFYGILDSLDNSARITATDRSGLQAQQILVETSGFGYEVRVVSKNPVDWASGKKGWYMDLVSPALGAQGERVVDPPLLVGENLVFTTLIPSGNTCDFGGDGWLMEIEPHTGARTDGSVFDLNKDGKFDSSEYVTVTIDSQVVTVPVNGKKSKEGIITTPGVINAGNVDYKLTSTSSGTIETTVEKATGQRRGRGSWRQLR